MACFPVSYSCTSLKCYMINVWKAIRIKSGEIYISYIKRNICSSLKSNEQSNVCVLISIYRPNLYVTIEEVTWRSLQIYVTIFNLYRIKPDCLLPCAPCETLECHSYVRHWNSTVMWDYNNQAWSRMWDGTFQPRGLPFHVRSEACQVSDKRKPEGWIISSYIVDHHWFFTLFVILSVNLYVI